MSSPAYNKWLATSIYGNFTVSDLSNSSGNLVSTSYCTLPQTTITRGLYGQDASFGGNIICLGDVSCSTLNSVSLATLPFLDISYSLQTQLNNIYAVDASQTYLNQLNTLTYNSGNPVASTFTIGCSLAVSNLVSTTNGITLGNSNDMSRVRRNLNIDNCLRIGFNDATDVSGSSTYVFDCSGQAIFRNDISLNGNLVLAKKVIGVDASLNGNLVCGGNVICYSDVSALTMHVSGIDISAALTALPSTYVPLSSAGCTILGNITFGNAIPLCASSPSISSNSFRVATTGFTQLLLSTNYYTSAQVDTTFTNYYTKSYIDASFDSITTSVSTSNARTNTPKSVGKTIFQTSTGSLVYDASYNYDSSFQVLYTQNQQINGTLNSVLASYYDPTSSIQNQLNLKSPLASPTFTGTVSGITATMVGLGNCNNTTDAGKPISTAQAIVNTAQSVTNSSVSTSLALLAPIASPTFTGTVSGITSTMVGLGNCNNTTDLLKPISTATQTALNLLAPLASPTFTGTVLGITKSMVGLGNCDNTTDLLKPISTATQTALNLKANLASPTFTGTVSGITSTMVGLGNCDNTTDLLKPISTATQTALNLKANLASPTFTGTVSGITSTMVGLGNCDNTTDLLKPISTATQTALNLKANLASPTFTGTVSGITSTMVGLGNCDNTTDLLKPISTAQAAVNTAQATTNATQATTNASVSTAMALLAPLSAPTFSGVATSVTPGTSNNTTRIATTQYVQSNLVSYALLASPTIDNPTFTTAAFSVTTTTANNSTRVATTAYVQNNLVNYTPTTGMSSYALLSGCTFTGTVNGITSAMVGLGNCNNTSDANKPISTATQTALDAKLNGVIAYSSTNMNLNATGGAVRSFTVPSAGAFWYYVDGNYGADSNLMATFMVVSAASGTMRFPVQDFPATYSWTLTSTGSATFTLSCRYSSTYTAFATNYVKILSL